MSRTARSSSPYIEAELAVHVDADVVPYHPNHSNNDRCPICANDWDDPNVDQEWTIVTARDCQHSYHWPCLQGWLVRNNNTCPLCRRQLYQFPTPLVHSVEFDDSEDEDESDPEYTVAQHEAAIAILRVNKARMVRYVRQEFFRELRARRRRNPPPPTPLKTMTITAYCRYRARTRGRSRDASNIAQHYPVLVMGRAMLALARERNLEDDTAEAETMIRRIEEDDTLPNGD